LGKAPYLAQDAETAKAGFAGIEDHRRDLKMVFFYDAGKGLV
jgi:hypothetical protein